MYQQNSGLRGGLNDVSTDPSETTDVSASYPEVIDQLLKSYDVWWAATVPLMVNEGVTTQRVQRNSPLAVRYRIQLDDMAIADWNPHLYDTKDCSRTCLLARRFTSEMKRIAFVLTCLPVLFGAVIVSAEENSNQNRSWSARLEYVGIAVEEPGYHVWGASPVVGPNGRTHLFVSRWPVKAGFGAWTTHCEIARYVSDHPEGPFAFQEVVLRGTDRDTWDRQSPHNPNVQKVGDQYVLLYIANQGGVGKEKIASQQIGMVIANSPQGPWKKVGEDGLILSVPHDQLVWSHASTVGVNNPALFAHPDGRYFLYYKAMRKGDVRRMGVAIADKVDGPYIFYKDPLTSNRSEIEDGYAFYEKGMIYLLTTHNREGTGYLWESQDGIHFGEPILGFDKMESYLSEDTLRGAKRIRGNKFERPQLLLQNGHPTYLYVASGMNYEGGSGSYSCVLRVHEAK